MPDVILFLIAILSFWFGALVFFNFQLDSKKTSILTVIFLTISFACFSWLFYAGSKPWTHLYEKSYVVQEGGMSGGKIQYIITDDGRMVNLNNEFGKILEKDVKVIEKKRNKVYNGIYFTFGSQRQYDYFLEKTK